MKPLLCTECPRVKHMAKHVTVNHERIHRNR